MKPEYHEGPKALTAFKEGMTKLFQVAKDATKESPKPIRKRASKG
jgi:hypothetical protein